MKSHVKNFGIEGFCIFASFTLFSTQLNYKDSDLLSANVNSTGMGAGTLINVFQQLALATNSLKQLSR